MSNFDRLFMMACALLSGVAFGYLLIQVLIILTLQ